jgi:hypothetical protein
MLSRGEIQKHIESELGIERTYHLRYADEYNAHPNPFYLKSANKQPIVIHPDAADSIRREPIDGVRLGERYFNSALRKFPRLEVGREPCGYPLEINSFAALDAVLLRIGAVSASSVQSSPELDDISAIAPSLTGVSETERVALIAARLGQGLFRQRLMHVWQGRCAVKGIGVAALLRASHIKPWRLGSNNERLDPDNGLLLVANLDAAFDARLVSFSDSGTILFSAHLGSAPHDTLGIRRDAKLTRQPSPRQQDFLKHHRNAADILV